MSELFGEADVVHRYSRREALADGVLVDVSSHPELGPLVSQAGIRFPLAMTAEAFDRCVALRPAAVRAGCDLRGRCWDVLQLLFRAIRRETARGSDTDTVLFSVLVHAEEGLVRCPLKAVVGPGDEGEPVLTVMLPHES